MKTARTICAIVLGLALGTDACGQPSNGTRKCPTAESSFTIRVQQAEKYSEGLLSAPIANYNAKRQGIELKEKFEAGKFVGFEVHIRQPSACYQGMETEIANLYQDAINRLKD